MKSYNMDTVVNLAKTNGRLTLKLEQQNGALDAAIDAMRFTLSNYDLQPEAVQELLDRTLELCSIIAKIVRKP